ncbi:MAG: chemotaxis protein CheW [Phycisphaerales bacterium]|nr:chemotaxis protein CheW [Phycisphaerales bacterium]
MQHESMLSEQSGEQLQLVSFTVGEELFAVNILSVQEINRMMSLTKVPQSSDGIEGVINLRGRIIPVLNLRSQFGIPAAEINEDSRIIVVDVAGSTVGFIVDSVQRVLLIDNSIIEPTPLMSTSIDSSYVRGVAKLDEELLILLDLDNLLSPEHLSALENANKRAA